MDQMATTICARSERDSLMGHPSPTKVPNIEIISAKDCWPVNYVEVAKYMEGSSVLSMRALC